jgi:probable rRNA maturation factor
VNIDVVDDQDDPLEPGLAATAITELVRVVLDGERYPASTEVVVTLVDEQAIASLNERHLEKTGPTDVLSFPIEDLVPGVVPEAPPDGIPLVIGDVVICPVVVRRQAAARRVAFADEMALMVTHGVLHLLGYDHQVDAEAEHMEGRERTYLRRVGRERP